MPVPVDARSQAYVYGLSPAATVGSNPTGGMDVCFVCCQVEVSATGWSLVQRSPTDCGASLCVMTKPREQGGHSPRWAAEPEKKISQNIIAVSLRALSDWSYNEDRPCSLWGTNLG
jgi:hypothetical protein